MGLGCGHQPQVQGCLPRYWLRFKYEIGPKPAEWSTIFLKFWFPKQKVLASTQISKCLDCFTKPMQMNILSYIRERAKENRWKNFMIPNRFRKGCVLFGHDPTAEPPHQQELEPRGEQYDPQKQEDRTTGWVYPVKEHQRIVSQVSYLHLIYSFSLKSGEASPNSRLGCRSTSSLTASSSKRASTAP